MNFSITCADIISTHIQLKCNNDLLPRCIFLNTVGQKHSFHYFLMESGQYPTETNSCFSFFSTQFSTWFSSFLIGYYFIFTVRNYERIPNGRQYDVNVLNVYHPCHYTSTYLTVFCEVVCNVDFIANEAH